MHVRKFYVPFKIVSYVVLALMLGAALYASIMIIRLWTGINV